MNTIKNLIGKLQNKECSERFTGNLYRRYPYLLECAPLPDKDRLRLILSPTEATWYFITPDGEAFNFYPIFLYLTSQRTGIQYSSISYKLSLKQSANLHLNNYIKY